MPKWYVTADALRCSAASVIWRDVTPWNPPRAKSRSARASGGYLGGGLLTDARGFVDSGDMVELRAGRYHFVGRRNGVVGNKPRRVCFQQFA